MNRSPLKLPAALATAVVLLLPLTGCGGDDEKPTSTASTTLDPVRAGYAEEVTPICERAAVEVDAISESFAADQSTAKFKESLQQASRVILAEVEELREVNPPDSLADGVDAWLTALAKAARRLPTLVPADSKKGVDAFVDSDPLARALGLNICTSTGE